MNPKNVNDDMFEKIIKKYSNAPDFLGIEINDIHVRTKFGDQLIHCACVLGDTTDIKYLLDHGANINSRGEDNFTPLHYAVQQGHVNAIKILLTYNPDLSLLNSNDETALELAVNLELHEIVKIIQTNGVGSNKK